MPAASESVVIPRPDDGSEPTAKPRAIRPARPDRAAAAGELRRAFCAQLLAARERRGVSLHAIASATNISESLFSDLEHGNLSRWPTGIYRRSFFREYAQRIGLPVESTTSEFVRLFPDERPGVKANAAAPGPLRLTLARSALPSVPAAWAQAAVLDALVVGAMTAALVLSLGLGFWITLAIVALGYFLAGTAFLGCSLATWWFQHQSGHPQGFKLFGILLLVGACAAPAIAQSSSFEPEIGQPGKDVVWVPSPNATVEAMLDLAKLTPEDFVMDLGSGDGRNVIAAARRGARGRGVEYNPEMVALSKRNAAAAGVADRAEFVEGDMFAADVSEADVLALFLLPSNLLRLRSTFLDMRPGTRIVSNTFSIQDWDAKQTVDVGGDCTEWCSAHLYIVPARVGGAWQMGAQRLALAQTVQTVTGTLTSDSGASTAVAGKVMGADLSLTAGDLSFAGTVSDGEITGTMQRDGQITLWRASRAN